MLAPEGVLAARVLWCPCPRLLGGDVGAIAAAGVVVVVVGHAGLR